MEKEQLEEIVISLESRVHRLEQKINTCQQKLAGIEVNQLVSMLSESNKSNSDDIKNEILETASKLVSISNKITYL